MRPMPEWYCRAYGPEIPTTCFFAETYPCPDEFQCEPRLAAERVRIHASITRLAASGSTVWGDVLDACPTPESLLGGRDDVDQADNQ